MLKRGNVTANLTVRREGTTQLVANLAVLDRLVALAIALHARLRGSELPRADALLALPGVLRQAAAEEEERPLAAVQAGFANALNGLVAACFAEGLRLEAMLSALLTEIAELCQQVRAQAAGQPASQRARMTKALGDLQCDRPGLPEERVAQEVALLAMRSDVREELDSYVAAARELVGEGPAVGRRLDFLVQEFNRDANTLCSKSVSAGLTAIGLRLKAAIEQLREQAQNIE